MWRPDDKNIWFKPFLPLENRAVRANYQQEKHSLHLQIGNLVRKLEYFWRTSEYE
jgi:hypothetical protein